MRTWFNFEFRAAWLFAAISLTSGVLLSLSKSTQAASLGFAIGSTAILSCVVGARFYLAPRIRPPTPKLLSLSTLFGLLFLLCGFTWLIPALLTTRVDLQTRNASVLLLTGGATFTLSQFHASRRRRSAFHAPVWLAAAAMAVVVIWLAVLTVSQIDLIFLDRAPLSWGFASLMEILGLTIIIAIAIGRFQAESTHTSDPVGMPGQLGWAMAGIGFVLHGIFLLQESQTQTMWWLPLLAVGVLLATSRPVTKHETGPVTLNSTWRQPLRGPVLAGLVVTACLSAAALVSLLQQSPSPTDWALMAASAFMLALSTLTVCVSALTFQGRVSELGKRVGLLSRLSQTDSLTGIANRRAIDERLTAEIQRAARFGHPLTVGLIDVDDFKQVNDALGHAAGDAVLQRLAVLLERELRTIDVAGRYGGEEFLIVLPETDAAGAAIAATRILAAVRCDRHLFLAARQPSTVSIGISEFETNGRSSSELLDAADGALYRAKREGKNRVVIAGTGL